MAGLFLDEQKKTSKEKEQPSETKRNDLERTAKGMETQDTSGVSTNEGGQEVDAGFVEFLPVEWYEQVRFCFLKLRDLALFVSWCAQLY